MSLRSSTTLAGTRLRYSTGGARERRAEMSRAVDAGARVTHGQVLARLGRPEEAQAEFAIAKKMVNADLSKRRESLSDQRIPNPELAQPPQ